MSQAHCRPCFQAMANCKKFCWFLPMRKIFLPRENPIHVTKCPNNGTQRPAKHNRFRFRGSTSPPREDFMTELSIILLLAHSVVAPFRPNMLPVRPTKIFVSSNAFAKRVISSANLTSKSVRMPLCKSTPRFLTSQHQHPKATSKTHENNRGVNTHPCRKSSLWFVKFPWAGIF